MALRATYLLLVLGVSASYIACKSLGDVEEAAMTETKKEHVLVNEIDISNPPDVLSKEDILELERKLALDESKYVLEDFKPLAMSTNFKSYDLNGNGGISLEELKTASGATENISEAFDVTDSDENGEIDEDEFHTAPWRLQPFKSRHIDDSDNDLEYRLFKKMA